MSGTFLRSLGWVGFGLVMAGSFASLADIPSGFAYLDQSHPVDLVIAALIWAACAATSWAARLRHVDKWFLRPVTLRVVAMVAVFALSMLATWQTDRHNQELFRKEIGHASSANLVR